MRRRTLLGLAAAAAAGCAPALARKMDFSEKRRAFRPDDYQMVHRAWTRHAKLVRDVGTVIEAWGTLKSWEFRQAYIAQYAAIYNLSEADRRALEESELATARAGWDFHVAVQTTNYRWNDLGEDSSPWKVTLVDAKGVEVPPASIVKPDLPELYESTFFPNRTDFSRTYEIKFVAEAAEEAGFQGPASGRIALRISGPLGKIELTWEAAG